MESESNVTGNEPEAAEAAAGGAFDNPSYAAPEIPGCCLAKIPPQWLNTVRFVVQLIAFLGVSWMPHKYLFPHLEAAIGNEIEVFGYLIAFVFTFGMIVLSFLGEKVHKRQKIQWIKKMSAAGLLFVFMFVFSQTDLGISSIFDCGDVPKSVPEEAVVDSSEKKEL